MPEFFRLLASKALAQQVYIFASLSIENW